MVAPVSLASIAATGEVSTGKEATLIWKAESDGNIGALRVLFPAISNVTAAVAWAPTLSVATNCETYPPCPYIVPLIAPVSELSDRPGGIEANELLVLHE